MSLITSYLKKNPCYTVNAAFVPKGIMVSMVGCPQPSAKVFINNWNRESYTKACPHVLIDANDGNVYQTLPFDIRGRFFEVDLDDQYINVLLCEPSQIKYSGGEHFSIVGDKEKATACAGRAFWSAVEACKEICKLFNFDPMTQIYSPTEGCNNPKEPNAFWRNIFGDDVGVHTMDGLKCLICSDDEEKPEAIIEHATDATVESKPAPATAISASAESVVVTGEVASVPEAVVTEPAMVVSVFDHAEEISAPTSVPAPKVINIQIDVPNLRIRKGPGTGAGCEPIGKYTGVGMFQITEVQNGSGSKSGWGKLASGEGWVSMDFVKVL